MKKRRNETTKSRSRAKKQNAVQMSPMNLESMDESEVYSHSSDNTDILDDNTQTLLQAEEDL